MLGNFFASILKQERVTYFSTHAIDIGPVLSNTLLILLTKFSKKNTSFRDSKNLKQLTKSTFKCVKVCINYINRSWYVRFLQSDISYDIRLWPGVLNFQIRFVNGSNSVLLPITYTFKALKTFLPEPLPFYFLFSFLMGRLFKQMCVM